MGSDKSAEYQREYAAAHARFMRMGRTELQEVNADDGRRDTTAKDSAWRAALTERGLG